MLWLETPLSKTGKEPGLEAERAILFFSVLEIRSELTLSVHLLFCALICCHVLSGLVPRKRPGYFLCWKEAQAGA